MANNATITEFLTAFKNGGARPNRFLMNFTDVPNVASTFLKGDAKGMLCKSTTIPASNIGMVPLKWMGRTVKVPGDKQFDDWTVTFLNDNNFEIRKGFEKWLNAINGHESNIDTAFDADWQNYFGTANVYQLNRKNETVATYTLSKIWPTTVSEIQLSYDNDDQVEEFTVTFAVNEWFSDATGNPYGTV